MFEVALSSKRKGGVFNCKADFYYFVIEGLKFDR
jgi:hypothetical protein